MENKVVRDAFKEAYIVLNELDLYKRLPAKLKSRIEETMDPNHTFSFDKNIPLFNQVNNDVTRNLLTYIYISYINNNNGTDEFFEDELNEIIRQANI